MCGSEHFDFKRNPEGAQVQGKTRVEQALCVDNKMMKTFLKTTG